MRTPESRWIGVDALLDEPVALGAPAAQELVTSLGRHGASGTKVSLSAAPRLGR